MEHETLVIPMVITYHGRSQGELGNGIKRYGLLPSQAESCILVGKQPIHIHDQ